MHLVIFIIAIIGYSIYRIDQHYKHEKRGWKVYRKSRVQIIYSEKHNEEWKTIEIDAGVEKSLVPYFKNEEEWKSYPTWARANRTIIMERVLEKFPFDDNISEIGTG